jgi:hypothetical protein
VTRLDVLPPLALALAAAACAATPPELTLAIRLPADSKGLLAAVATLDLTATRDGSVLAHAIFAGTTRTVSLVGVSHGARTIAELDGMDSQGVVIAQGRTCGVDFEGPGTTAPLYFAPTNFFAPTSIAAGDLPTPRADPVAMALGDGTVLVAGGADAAGTALATSDLFTPGRATFAPNAGVTMNHARKRAQATPIASLGLLVTGGLDAKGDAVADAEVYLESRGQFVPVTSNLLDARVGHRTVLLPDGRALVTGGAPTDDGKTAPVATPLFVYVASDGTFTVTAGLGRLAEARREHAATVAVGVPLLFGGWGAAGAPLDSIEAVDTTTGAGTIIAHLHKARAEATASLLADGSILVVGGRDASGVLADAELYNPITRETTSKALGVGRSGHTATVLDNGRVLVAGGRDGNGQPLDSVELFVPGATFLNERKLDSKRAGHVTVPLCDGTALVVGGGDGAELYSGPAD